MFISNIKLRNFLSFGPDAQELELKPLNVLIGPNGSGKSNLVELIGLLKAVPGDLADPLLRGAPPNEWLWRGEPKAHLAEVEIVVAGPAGRGPLRYRLAIELDPGTFRIAEERLEDVASEGRRVHLQSNGTTSYVGLRQVAYDFQKSVLANFKHPDYPELVPVHKRSTC